MDKKEIESLYQIILDAYKKMEGLFEKLEKALISEKFGTLKTTMTSIETLEEKIKNAQKKLSSQKKKSNSQNDFQKKFRQWIGILENKQKRLEEITKESLKKTIGKKKELSQIQSFAHRYRPSPSHEIPFYFDKKI